MLLIEQVDRAFLKEHFGRSSRGNLFKVYCGQIGPGTLEHRVGPDGDDSGRQYRTEGDDPTYRLKSYSGADSYDDLAEFVRARTPSPRRCARSSRCPPSSAGPGSTC